MKKKRIDKKELLIYVLTPFLVIGVVAEIIVIAMFLKDAAKHHPPKSDNEGIEQIVNLDNFMLTGNQAALISEVIFDDYNGLYYVEFDNGVAIKRYESYSKEIINKNNPERYVCPSDTYVSELIRGKNNELQGVRFRKYSK